MGKFKEIEAIEEERIELRNKMAILKAFMAAIDTWGKDAPTVGEVSEEIELLAKELHFSVSKPYLQTEKKLNDCEVAYSKLTIRLRELGGI